MARIYKSCMNIKFVKRLKS